MSALFMEAAGVVPQLAATTKFLQPGQLFATQQPTMIKTILGSCVAVCLYDRARHLGGMNHFMLPIRTAGHLASPRFGEAAMDGLVQQMCALGAKIRRLEARVFGGACMFAEMAAPDHLGARNAALALDYLAASHIEVVQVDVGGSRGRKLEFDTWEGLLCRTLI